MKRAIEVIRFMTISFKARSYCVSGLLAVESKLNFLLGSFREDFRIAVVPGIVHMQCQTRSEVCQFFSSNLFLLVAMRYKEEATRESILPSSMRLGSVSQWIPTVIIRLR
jgi:hypothetical protein